MVEVCVECGLAMAQKCTYLCWSHSKKISLNLVLEGLIFKRSTMSSRGGLFFR